MEELKEKISDIIMKVESGYFTTGFAESSIIELIESEIDKAKEKVADTILDLPNDCIKDCSDTKFCSNRLDHCNRCKECFSLDNI